jgi:hypothetical protein
MARPGAAAGTPLRVAAALALLACFAAADGSSRALNAVPAPAPSSGWCGGAPTQTFGTVPEAAASCLGDVAVAAGAAAPTCNATDQMFQIPSLHFHQARPLPPAIAMPLLALTCVPRAGDGLRWRR